MNRASLLFVLFVAFAADTAKSQTSDVLISSAAGGSAGGLAGLLLAMPKGCGGVFANSECRLAPVATGFAAGNLLGSAWGASRARGLSACSPLARFGLALIGGATGAGVGVAAVGTTHGYLRIGLSPLVQLAESEGAAQLLKHCHSSAPRFRDSTALANRGSEFARAAAVAGLAGGYAGLYVYFKHAWWSGTPAPHWFVRNDWDQNERDEDKFGHLFGGYQLTRVTSELLDAGGIAPDRAILISALYAFAFQFQIEEWDGTQKMYGFSPGDLIADASGAALAVAQNRVPALRAIKPVWSYSPTLAYRRRNEPGHNGQPRATTDYSGQTYWLSVDLKSLLPDDAKKFWPAAIRVSPGYSITDYADPNTGGPIRARRKLLLSLDLDPEHLPGDNRTWKVIKHELSFLRIPGPTFQFTPSGKFFPLYN